MIWLGRQWDIILFITLVTAFLSMPEIDLTVSHWFYRPGDGFFLRNLAWVQFVYHAIPQVATWLTVTLSLILLVGFLPQAKRLANYRSAALFLLLSLGIGPGLLVNGLLKEHWGRARPADIQEFGGEKTFTPAFVVTDQCERNCSFVSGHAAQGFFFSLLGFLTRRRIWFLPGLALGGMVGFARIVQGKHFLSDVIFALFAVYFVGKLVFELMKNLPKSLALQNFRNPNQVSLQQLPPSPAKLPD